MPRTYSSQIYGLSERNEAFPTELTQWSVVGPGGHRAVYGDQHYVADRQVLRDEPEGRIERRTITIIYGEWVPDA